MRSEIVSASSFIPPQDLEVVCVVIRVPHLCCVYVPPNAPIDYHESLHRYLLHLASGPNQLIVLGDFNYPDICWSSMIGSTTISYLFCEAVFNANLSQLINVPMHVKGNILDLVLTSDEDMVYCIEFILLNLAQFSVVIII